MFACYYYAYVLFFGAWHGAFWVRLDDLDSISSLLYAWVTFCVYILHRRCLFSFSLVGTFSAISRSVSVFLDSIRMVQRCELTLIQPH